MAVRRSNGDGSLHRRVAPLSLTDWASSRESCSVTDLVSPVWCEYAFQYNLLGMGHLPVSQRPEEIATPEGNVVKVNVEKAEQREKVLDAGRLVHRRLEKEIHPVRVYIETTTREDGWGLRILQLITGLKVLIQGGCCRELPVFGFIEGQLVFGVIDEIKVHDSSESGEGKGEKAKRWSSQEEWKRASVARQAKQRSDSSQPTLASFLPSARKQSQTRGDDGNCKQEPRRYFGFVLEDAKTRLSMSMPSAEDQVQSKLQCMLYKRLLDGLVAGLASDTHSARLDQHATPVRVDALLDHVGLQGNVGLSDAFMSDAEDLCRSFDLTLQVKPDGHGGWTCDLHYLFGLLVSTLDDLVDVARKGAADVQHFSVIQDELRLTYRRREGRWSRRKQTVSSEELEEAQVEAALQISCEDTRTGGEEQLANQTIALPLPPSPSVTRATVIGTARFSFDSHRLQAHVVDIMAMWKGERPLRGVTLEQTWRCNHCEYLNDCEWRHLKADEGLRRARSKRREEEEEALWSQVDDVPDDMEW